MNSKSKRIALLLFTMVTAPFAWRSELYPSTWTPPTESKSFASDKIIQDFSYAGYHRGEKAIPDVAGPLFDVTQSPYNADKSGNSDATAAIQAAINAAGNAGGGVVYLPAGTYLLKPGDAKQALKISKSNIVIRGAGVGKTFLLNTQTSMRDKHLIRFEGAGSGWTTVPNGSPVVSLTKDVLGPTKTITVQNASSFAVGEWVIVRSDITNSWADEHNEPEWRDKSGSFFGMIYLRQITARNTTSNTLTLDIPIRYAMKVRDNARVYRAPAMMSEVGIEQLSIGNAQLGASSGWGEEDYKTSGTPAYNAHASYLVVFERVRNGWMRDVESYKPASNSSGAHLLSNGLLLSNTRGVTVERCHFQRAQYGGGGGNGYMYRLSGQENLLKDSKATFARHGFVLSQMGASGNVFLNCYDKDGGKQTGLSGSMNTSGRGSDHHMHFSHSNLFDNCTAENSNFQAAYRPYGSDPKHNLTAAHSVYWRTRGLGTQDPWVIHTQQSRYGYAIGTWGTVTAVKTSGTNSSSEPKTSPVDHTEGIGTGDGLYPQSLYADQLSKRIGGTSSSSTASSSSTTSSSSHSSSSSVSSSSSSVARAPYGGKPHSIPGTLEAEEYDLGGAGVAYFDTTPENEGDANFRTAEGVDISNRDNGMSIIHTQTGEWIEFTVEVSTAGLYSANFRLVAIEAGKQLRLIASRNGAEMLIDAPVQPDWQTYGEVSDTLSLSKGEQILRLHWENAPVSINWIDFELVQEEPSSNQISRRWERATLSAFSLDGRVGWRWQGDWPAEVKLYRTDGTLQGQRLMQPGEIWHPEGGVQQLYPKVRVLR